jgi:hypothetical protein
VNIHTDTAKHPAGIWLAAQALGGALCGLALGGTLGLIGARLFANAGNGWGDLIAAIVGAMIGYTIGVSIGVYALGQRLGSRSGYWRALLGSMIGVVLVLLAAEPLRLNQNTAVLQTFLLAMPPIGATLGFNMGRKARK